MAGEVMNDGLKFLADEPPWETACRGQLPFKREYLATVVRVQMAGTMKWQAQAPHICPSCGPGRCDGTTLDCTLDSYYANPANGPRPTGGRKNGMTAQAMGTAQNPMMCSECGTFVGHVWHCSQFRLPTYPATRYDDAPPTERLPVPPPLRCECGTGDHTRSGAHSHWCPCWVSA